ncbi:MAG: hypothetical protein DRJ07_20765 [Bacteroidetes bacterium]|nr:MAG: hypothetical protein DRJ07_20765 [Bacteroidota bacterium]
MKHIWLIIAGLIIGLSVDAQTIIKDKDNVSGIWKKSKSPYIIKGEAIVPEGKTLEIKPGVVVKFKTGEGRDYPKTTVGFLRVKGTLIAEGKEKKMITFTRDGSSGNWGVIQIHSESKNSIILYCKFEYAKFIRNIVSSDNATGALSLYDSYAEITNCIFVNGWVGINCKKGAYPLVKNNTIAGNQYGLECNTGSKPEVLNCILWNNKTTFFNNGESLPTLSNSLIGENPAKYGLEDNGTNLIGRNPKFKSEQKGDYNLKSDSPCIGKGKDGSNMGAF